MSIPLKFNKKVANDIASTSVDYVLESILDHSIDNRQHSLETTADSFIDNFIEDLEKRKLLVTEYRISVINDCFEKQLESIRNRIKVLKNKNFDRYSYKNANK